MRSRKRLLAAALGCTALLGLPAGAAQAARGPAGPPRAKTLSRGWEVRVEPAAPGKPQPPPPEESAPEGSAPTTRSTPAGRAAQTPSQWSAAQVPSVFDSRALPELFPGTVRRYRLRFRAPRTPRGFRWVLLFEGVRRSAGVFLNGRRLGGYRDPYTPFVVEARGLRPGRRNELVVKVDNRKDPRLPEGWWNWGGIVRPVRLMPVGRAHLANVGLMSRVRCRRPARSCGARLLVDATLQRRFTRRIRPLVTVTLRAPGGRVLRRRFRLAGPRRSRRRVRFSMRVPAPVLWSPDRPRLYSAQVSVRERGRLQQVERRRIGLRSVQVKGGMLFLNNRRIQLRGASIHEDMPGRGAGLSHSDMGRIVNDLKELGANVTRAHYLLNDRLLSKLDRAGIMVWSEAPIWQRDHGANLLASPGHRRRALETVGRTVQAARNHPSVITHSVANELSFTPDAKPGTRRFLTYAARRTRRLDPTLPVSLAIKGRPGFPEQFTYSNFDIIGLNMYFGWYRWVNDFSLFEPYLQEMRDLYPRQALVATEFGAEARPEMASAPSYEKGSYTFQAYYVDRKLDVIDRSRILSGGLYWTLREFEIYPGWTGGAGRRPGNVPDSRHHKGLVTYYGEKKPAWHVARDHFVRTPLYANGRH